ncbi:acetyl-CoA synthetase-like protein, partial [Aureobasidium melanogenum]
ALENSKMRLICNAAGGLLPSLACTLRDTFKCIVLPSYGMTECMPISSPPLDYQLDRSGTSGVSVGPDMAILDGNDQKLPIHTVGRIAVRGAPVFGGYLKDNDVLDTSCFTADGWFDTGDMGYLDADGYLYVTGRSKEVINRGGELISPFEIEEAVVTAAKREGNPLFGRVSAALAFSMPHDVLQEVPGVVLVTPLGARRADIKTVQEALKDSLSQVKWPAYVVYMDDLPKNNNKVLRIKLAERLGLSEITDETPLA